MNYTNYYNYYIIFSAKIVDSSALFNLFDCTSYIIASKNCNLDQAMEDAIIANAEEVEEIKYENFFIIIFFFFIYIVHR